MCAPPNNWGRGAVGSPNSNCPFLLIASYPARTSPPLGKCIPSKGLLAAAAVECDVNKLQTANKHNACETLETPQNPKPQNLRLCESGEIFVETPVKPVTKKNSTVCLERHLVCRDRVPTVISMRKAKTTKDAAEDYYGGARDLLR